MVFHVIKMISDIIDIHQENQKHLVPPFKERQYCYIRANERLASNRFLMIVCRLAAIQALTHAVNAGNYMNIEFWPAPKKACI